MSTPATTAEVDEYLAEVREHLADLNDEERGELLEDLKQHLSDIGAEEGGTSLRERLGQPESYADELRAAAGLSPKTTGDPPGDRVNLRQLLGEATRGTKQVALDLRPAWWVARGALLAALTFWWRPDGNDDFPVPSPFGMPVVGALVVALGAGLSVWVGRSADQRTWRRVGIAANVILMVGLAVGSLMSRESVSQYATVSRVPRLVSLHGPITNIYPYDAQGRPLEGVLLYDQDGRPLKADFQQWWEDRCARQPKYPLAADGVPVEFSYPREYRVVTHDEFDAMFEGSQCLREIPRPPVPIPTFPDRNAPPTTAPATEPLP